jgi:hypothetical protein
MTHGVYLGLVTFLGYGCSYRYEISTTQTATADGSVRWPSPAPHKLLRRRLMPDAANKILLLMGQSAPWINPASANAETKARVSYQHLIFPAA